MKDSLKKLYKLDPKLAKQAAKVLGYKITSGLERYQSNEYRDYKFVFSDYNSNVALQKAREMPRLKPGDYVVQKLKTLTTYGYVVEKLKSKGFKGIVIDDDRKKAVIKTISDRWFPLPIKIKESDVPPKLLAKIKRKLGKNKILSAVKKQEIKKNLNKLIELYAIKIYSGDQANIRIADKMHKRFYNYYNKLASKYPNYDFSSDRFWSKLEFEAKKWWNKQAQKGPGKHW